jgi:hypothetical protein
MIVNKTNHDILNGDQVVKSMHSDFLRLDDGISKARLHAFDYGPSQPIDLNQVGMTGTITMDSETEE